MHLMIFRIQSILAWSLSHLRKVCGTQRLADWILIKAHHYSLFLKTQQPLDNQSERTERLKPDFVNSIEYLEAMLGDFFEVLAEEKRKARWHKKDVPATKIIGYALELLLSTLQLAAYNACSVLQALLFCFWSAPQSQSINADADNNMT